MVLLFCSLPAMAAPVRVYVEEFKVTGAVGKDDYRQALQSLLASRLSGENVTLAGANEAPELKIAGTYIVFGKVFSLDARVVTGSGTFVGRAFEQGESSDDVIPAVGRLADKLSAEIAKLSAAGPVAPAPTPSTGHKEVTSPGVTVPSGAASSIVRPSRVETAKVEGDIIRAAGVTKAGESGMIGQRLDGVMVGIAQLKGAEKGKRDLVVALERELRLYGQDKGLTLLATESAFSGTEKILGVDVADLDGDGVEELYVTIIQGEKLVSRVYQVEKGKFRQIAVNLPYYFRQVMTGSGVSRICVQQISLSDDFYGDMYELVKKGNSFSTNNPVKLPRFGTIFNVAMLKGKDGNPLFVELHPDGYLTVYDEKGENLWRSSDKFGGSEAYFTREDPQNMRVTGSRDRKIFLEQRMVVTKDGTIIVPKNEGTFVIGDSRSFNKNSIYAFAWNGATLDELWHTKPSQNYLSDFLYDEGQKELVLLEVVKKAGIFEKGASAIAIKRVE